MLTEIEVGPFTFEYNEDYREMYIAMGEEQVGYCDHIWPDKWQAFLAELIKVTKE